MSIQIDKEIVANAPNGWTHVDSCFTEFEGFYYKKGFDSPYEDPKDESEMYEELFFWNGKDWKVYESNEGEILDVRSRKDIESLINLTEEKNRINAVIDVIYDKFYNIVRVGTWFAVSNRCVPTCEKDSDGYSLNLADAIQQAERLTKE